jgi:hypothetical protein
MALAKRRITQHKRFVLCGTYPNPNFVRTSFMLGTLVAIAGIGTWRYELWNCLVSL